MCLAASHPMAAPCWQESTGVLLGGRKDPWPLGTTPWRVPSAPSAWPTSIPGISHPHPLHRATLPVPGPPSRPAPGFLMLNPRHQQLLALLGSSGLPAPSARPRRARVPVLPSPALPCPVRGRSRCCPFPAPRVPAASAPLPGAWPERARGVANGERESVDMGVVMQI